MSECHKVLVLVLAVYDGRQHISNCDYDEYVGRDSDLICVNSNVTLCHLS